MQWSRLNAIAMQVKRDCIRVLGDYSTGEEAMLITWYCGVQLPGHLRSKLSRCGTDGVGARGCKPRLNC